MSSNATGIRLHEIPGYISLGDALIHAWNDVTDIVEKGIKNEGLFDVVPEHHPDGREMDRLTAGFCASDPGVTDINTVYEPMREALCAGRGISKAIHYAVPREYDVRGLPRLDRMPTIVSPYDRVASVALYRDNHFVQVLFNRIARDIAEVHDGPMIEPMARTAMAYMVASTEAQTVQTFRDLHG